MSPEHTALASDPLGGSPDAVAATEDATRNLNRSKRSALLHYAATLMKRKDGGAFQSQNRLLQSP